MLIELHYDDPKFASVLAHFLLKSICDSLLRGLVYKVLYAFIKCLSNFEVITISCEQRSAKLTQFQTSLTVQNNLFLITA